MMLSYQKLIEIIDSELSSVANCSHLARAEQYLYDLLQRELPELPHLETTHVDLQQLVCAINERDEEKVHLEICRLIRSVHTRYIRSFAMIVLDRADAIVDKCGRRVVFKND